MFYVCMYYELLYFSIKSHFQSPFQKASLNENASFKISNKLYYATGIIYVISILII